MLLTTHKVSDRKVETYAGRIAVLSINYSRILTSVKRQKRQTDGRADCGGLLITFHRGRGQSEKVWILGYLEVFRGMSSFSLFLAYDTIRYEMLFNVRSKADMSQLNLPH